MDEKKLLPFDLEKALKGAKVITRDGGEVKAICVRENKKYPEYPISGILDGITRHWTLSGHWSIYEDTKSDLFLLDESEPRKVESIVLPSKEEFVDKAIEFRLERKAKVAYGFLYDWLIEHIDKEWYKPGVQPTNIEDALAEYDYDEILETIPMDVVKDWGNSHEGGDEPMTAREAAEAKPVDDSNHLSEDTTNDESSPVDPFPKPIHDFDGVDVDKYLEIVRTGEGNLDDCLTYEVKPFDLEVAKEHPEWVYNRLGNEVRIICTDRKDSDFHLVCLAKVGKYEGVFECTKDGYAAPYTKNIEANYDLVLRVPKPKKCKEVMYVNFYTDLREFSWSLYDTPEEAKDRSIKDRPSVVAKIEWECVEELCGTSSSK